MSTRREGRGVAIALAILGSAGCSVVFGLDEKQLGVLDGGAGAADGAGLDVFAPPGPGDDGSVADTGPVGNPPDATPDGGGADAPSHDANQADDGAPTARDAGDASTDAGTTRPGCAALAHTCGLSG